MSERGKHLIWLIGLALVVRIIFRFLYDPLLFHDSADYLELARMILSGDFSGYNGARTPLYSLLLAAAGTEFATVALLQTGMGLLIVVMLYYIFSRAGRSNLLGFFAALAYALNPSQMVFEISLLSETLSVFLLVACFLCLVKALDNPKGLHWWLLLGLGTGLGALARPVFQLFVPVFCIAAAVGYYLNSGRRLVPSLAAALLVLLPSLALIGGWSQFNYRHTGWFTLSTLAGFNLTNHTGKFMERAPDEYAQIRDIYLEHRSEVIASKGTSASTIWHAMDDLRERTGEDWATLSKKFLALSVRLIAENPGAYALSTAKSFVIFWLPTWYAEPGGYLTRVRHSSSAEVLMLFSYGLVHTFLLFVFWSYPLLCRLPRWREQLPRFGMLYAVIYFSTFALAFAQAAVEYGENARYKTPVEPLLLGVAVCVVVHWMAWQGYQAGRRDEVRDVNI